MFEPHRTNASACSEIIVTTHWLIDTEGTHECTYRRSHTVTSVWIDVVWTEARFHQLNCCVTFHYTGLNRTYQRLLDRSFSELLSTSYHYVECFVPRYWCKNHHLCGTRHLSYEEEAVQDGLYRTWFLKGSSFNTVKALFTGASGRLESQPLCRFEYLLVLNSPYHKKRQGALSHVIFVWFWASNQAGLLLPVEIHPQRLPLMLRLLSQTHVLSFSYFTSSWELLLPVSKSVSSRSGPGFGGKPKLSLKRS